jgi:DNA repair protein RadC
MKRTANNQPLFKAAETGNSTGLTTGTSPERVSAAGGIKPELSEQYVPVYRVELVRERSIRIEPRRPIRNSEDVVALLKDELLKADREKLICLMLDAKNFIIGMEVVSVGTLTASLVSCRELFKAAILATAAAIIVSHPHISGDPTPSLEDVRLTERISKAGQILGIKLLDHVIIGQYGTYSFSNAGRLP